MRTTLVRLFRDNFPGSSEESWRLSIVAECIAVVVTSRI